MFEELLTVAFLGWIVTSAKKDKEERELEERREKEERERKAREEEKRMKTPITYEEYLSQEQFNEIALMIAKPIKRLKIVVKGPFVVGTVRSQSGISEWEFLIDFNDYGKLSGKYWLTSDNYDSTIPGNVADRISNAIIDKKNQYELLHPQNKVEEIPDEPSLSSSQEKDGSHRRIKAFFFNKKNLEMEFSTSDLIGDDFQKVLAKFAEVGFNNCKAVPIKDIYVDSENHVGEVEQIIINGKTNIHQGAMVPYDAEIIVKYHMKKEFKFLLSTKQISKLNSEQVKKILLASGFTNVETVPLQDLKTGWIHKENSVQQIVVKDVKKLKQGMIFEYDKPITIQYHSFADYETESISCNK